MANESHKFLAKLLCFASSFAKLSYLHKLCKIIILNHTAVLKAVGGTVLVGVTGGRRLSVLPLLLRLLAPSCLGEGESAVRCLEDEGEKKEKNREAGGEVLNEEEDEGVVRSSRLSSQDSLE